jgi:hypothetical protein
MNLMEVLRPVEPIVSGFASPRLVSFADPDEPGYQFAGKLTKEMIRAERVRLLEDAMRKLGGECLSAQIGELTGLPAPVVSRILQTMRRDGLVSSRRIPGATSRMWVKI